MEVKLRTARTLVSKLSSVSEQTRSEALKELRLITKHDADSRPFVADAGAIPYLAETLFGSTPDFQDDAAATLLNISISCRQSLISTRGLLDAISHALRNHGSPTSSATAVQSSAATLHSLLVVEDYRPIIGAKRDIVYSLVDIIKSPKSPPRSVKDALKALFGIALYPLNRASLVELGAVPALFTLVVNDGRLGIVEDATAVIAQVAGCEESEDAFRRVAGVRVLADLLDFSTGSSLRSRENAVSALLNLAQCGGGRAVAEVREEGMGVVDGIADVAENGGPKGKSKGVALMKVIDGGNKSISSIFRDPRSVHFSTYYFRGGNNL
ncbi:protein spotted leaf 11 isoform X1 [Rosa rugosa]|uniref:protein spotted leaf 11 isoform X1 n=2 Tax=Rosa rugosa TaxID=74645 RepID=UPI002B407898|nr:protein spotted leaf 11 isoform X1 [Rosa rugosa]